MNGTEKNLFIRPEDQQIWAQRREMELHLAAKPVSFMLAEGPMGAGGVSMSYLPYSLLLLAAWAPGTTMYSSVT